MTENEKTELFDKWYDENYDEWAEGEEGIALREELEQAFKGGIAELENKIADIKANCDLAIEGRDLKIDELEQKLEQTEKDLADYQFNYPKIKELQKENEELKKQGDKWFVFETEAGNWGMDKATQYTVDRHNYFYGTKEECQKWGVEHKIKDYTGHKYCYDRLDNQLAKAKEIIREFMRYEINEYDGSLEIHFEELKKQAEQFIREIEK